MNALYKQIFDAVVQGRTNRPSLVVETNSAIKEATLELHGSARFHEDLEAANIFISTGQATKFRFTMPVAMRSIWKVTAISTTEVPLKRITLQEDPRWLVDWYRVQGKSIEAQVSKPTSAFRVDYFGYPDVSEANYNSWIAQRYPYAVADLAAAKLFMLFEPRTAQLFFARVGSISVGDTHLAKIYRENSNASD